MEKGEMIFKSGAVRRVCGICGGDLYAETSVTGFRIIEEATPKLFALEQANLVAMRILQMRRN